MEKKNTIIQKRQAKEVPLVPSPYLETNAKVRKKGKPSRHRTTIYSILILIVKNYL